MRIDTVLLLYNRPEHSMAVLDSLVKNGVERVRAFMDHPADADVARRQERLIESMRGRREIEVDFYRHAERQGLARSVRFALKETLAEADAAIVLEDDCVVRPGGIDYFRQGLTALRYDRRVRSLCGYLFPCPFLRSGSDPLLLRRFSTWGWATWRDRWADYDPDLKRVLARLSSRNIRVEEIADDLATLCRSDSYLQNRADIWSINWILEHFATGTFSVYPCDSLIENIGFDGSGNNCAPTQNFETSFGTMRQTWNFRQLVHLVENEEILRRFMAKHGLETYPSA
jgi:hypothetical protein